MASRNSPSAFFQARLANFWQGTGAALGSKYDALVAEERYEKFCTEFLSTLPSAFALPPDKQWDERLPVLTQQREILLISIFESLCYNFRPVLLLEANQVQDLPRYKQILVSSQRKALAVAALLVLRRVSRLHSLIGGSQTRYTGIIQPTFEAAVLLVSLCVDSDFLSRVDRGERREEVADVEDYSLSINKVDPLQTGMVSIRREECIQAIRNALSRLQVLAEASNMADVGAQTLAKMIHKVAKQPAQEMEKPSPPASGNSPEFTLPESSDSDPTVSLTDLGSVAAFEADMNMGWDTLGSL